MIKLQTSYSFSRVPYISNDALDDYAEVAIVDDKTWRGVRPCGISEAMPAVAYRRIGQADLAGRKLIKCPYCREALTDVERNTTVHIYRRKSKNVKPIPGQMFKMCEACKAEVGIIMIAG